MSSNYKAYVFQALLLATLVTVWQGRAPRAWATDVDWYTGASLQRALRHTVGLTWSETPLRSSLAQLARVQRVAIFLDRRIDPSQLIEFRSAEAPLEEVLLDLAFHLHADMTRLGSVVYIGPPDTAAVLAATAELRRRDAERLPAAAHDHYLAMASMQWPELAEPRTVMKELTGPGQIEVVGLDSIPHDLWPEVDLPPLALTDRLTLVLAGFDLTFRFEEQGRKLHLEPLPNDMPVERLYPHSLRAAELAKLVEQFSSPGLRTSRGRLVLNGTPAEHRRLQQLLRGHAQPQPNAGVDTNTVYTLTITNQPVGAVIQTLKQRGIQFRIDESLTQHLYTRVSFQVREVTLDALLEAALAPAGLAFERQGQEVVIRKGG